MKIRIRLSPVPERRSSPADRSRVREACESWETWVAMKCPREKPERPAERRLSEPWGHFAGHTVPKPHDGLFDE